MFPFQAKHSFSLRLQVHLQIGNSTQSKKAISYVTSLKLSPIFKQLKVWLTHKFVCVGIRGRSVHVKIFCEKYRKYVKTSYDKLMMPPTLFLKIMLMLDCNAKSAAQTQRKKGQQYNYELNKTIWVGKIPHRNNIENCLCIVAQMLCTFLLQSQERPKLLNNNNSLYIYAATHILAVTILLL